MSRSIIRRMWKPRYFDIGVNFSDSMFQGNYHGSSTKKHPADLDRVVERAKLFNVNNMLITASSIKESKEHFKLCETHENFHSTVGVHPCSVQQEFYHKHGDEEDATFEDVSGPKLKELGEIAIEGYNLGHIKAFGEIGLDYDRLHYSSKERQKEMFQKQLELFTSLKLDLPYFLHQRAAGDDFVEIIKPFIEKFGIRGVVHSFTGSEEELRKMLDLGFFVSVNGCSLKTEENLQVASKIPIEKLMIETDAPWCEIRKSHPGYKLLTPYPNKFYPPLTTGDDQSEDSATKNTPAPQGIKYHNFLPFPTIKNGNFAKHETIASNHAKSSNSEEALFSASTGPLAWPFMQSRNEPVFVGHVAEILCSLHGIKEDAEIENFLDLVYNNSCEMFAIKPIPPI